ncbi:anti-sigma factor family protein [Methylobacterium thuringiense]|uniref:Anti-sigma factor n=1 Tax=Methylobacterium thuringiense TaxID=1003091 RepID=A0ABQ4TLH9_9HYPH|nr:anti-sigma factor [Methylobacterium thuringiense]GJE54870.1 hypothetical protein EKPJFOCH_1355 [Methylobacterium thuringiense]
MSGPDPRPVGEDDLHAFVDGRLDTPRRAMVEAWLAEHPEAAGRIAADRAMREQLLARLAPVADEPIPARLRVANLTRPNAFRVARWRPFAAAALVFLTLGAGAGWIGRGLVHPSAPILLAAEPATQDAVAAFRTFVSETVHPVEVRANEMPHLVQWLSQRLGRRLVAPDLRGLGFRLMGGRLLPAGSEPAALLMYDDDKGTRLTLYSRAGTDAGRTIFRFAREGDVAAFSWIDAGMAYVVTARTPEARLLGVAEAVDAQVRGLAPARPAGSAAP